MHLLNTLPQRLDSGATPTFAGLIASSLTSPAATDLTLAGGSSGASLVLGQGAAAGTPTLTATGTGIVSVVGADSSGPATYAAQSRGGFRSYQDSGGSFGYNRYLDIIAAQSADGTNGGGVIRLLVNSITNASVPSEAARITKGGNLLIGGTTDISGTGGLKIFGSTAGSASAGALVVTGGLSAGNNGNASYFGGLITGPSTASFESLRLASMGFGIGTAFAGGQSEIYTSSTNPLGIGTAGNAVFRIYTNSTLACTFSAAQAATFAGAVESSTLNLRPLSNSPFTNSALIRNTANDGVFFANADVSKYAGLKTDGTFATNGAISAGAATFAGAVSVSGTAATFTSGTGSPESVKTAPVGSLYTRTDGGASTTLYVKESGAGNTGWIAK